MHLNSLQPELFRLNSHGPGATFRRCTALLLPVLLAFSGLVAFPAAAKASVPFCGGISQPAIPSATQTADGRASFTWESVYNGAEYKYSFTGWTGTQWTPWTNWASAGNSTSVTIPFEVYGTPVVRLSFAVIAQCWDYVSTGISPTGEAQIDLTLPATPPNRPTAVMTPTGAVIQVSSQLDSRNEAIIEYEIISEPQALKCRAPASSPSCVITGLQPGQAYRFYATAINKLGPSAPSEASVALYVPTRPDAPQSVRADVSRGKAIVVWDPPASDGYSPVTRYVVASDPDNHTCSTSGSTSCTVTGLANGKTYTFSVTAHNAIGSSEASSLSKPFKLLAVPSAPRQVSVKREDNSVTVSWLPPKSQGGSKLRRYEVSSSPASQGCRVKGQRCRISGLEIGRTYVFTVQAQNAKGKSPLVKSRPISIPIPPKAQQSLS